MKKKWIVAALVACAISLTGCKIISESDPIAVESVTLSETTLTLASGGTRRLTATVNPENADDKTVKWSSSNVEIATVSNDGTVAAVKTGTANITAQAGGKTATCVVTVKPTVIAVENVVLNLTKLSLAPGATGKLTATVTPSNADDKTVKWSSSNVEVATVGNDGTIVAIKTGTANVTAQAGGKTATCLVTVNEVAVEPDSAVVESVTLSAETLTIEPGKTRKLMATVTPSNADDKTVKCSSSNAEIATVDNDGTVTAIAEGTVTVTAQAGGKAATCVVTVKPILIAVERVTLNKDELTITRTETEKLTATVTPSNADDTSVAWSSSNAEVATVGNDGTVTAHKAGTAIITAQAGDMTAKCILTVNPILVESVTLDETMLAIEPGMTKKMNATIMPSNADDKTVIWSSSNTGVAIVGSDGTVVAIKAGAATITAQASGKTAKCEITVQTDHTYSGGKCTVCGVKPYLEGGTINDNGVLTKYSGTATTVVIPDGVTSIGSSAFLGCKSLTDVTIPDSVTSIGNEMFRGCTSLTSVVIPDSVTSIGGSAFSGCTSLTCVRIGNGVTDILRGAFYTCPNLTSVYYNGTETEWGNIYINASGLEGKTITGKDGSTWKV